MTTNHARTGAESKAGAKLVNARNAGRTKRKNGVPAMKPAIKRPRPASPGANARRSAAPRNSKQAKLIALLRSAKGGTIRQMTRLTGWQAHTIRGTISGILRKRLGLNVVCAARVGDAAHVYRIVGATAA